jgi:hypothetical protein
MAPIITDKKEAYRILKKYFRGPPLLRGITITPDGINYDGKLELRSNMLKITELPIKFNRITDGRFEIGWSKLSSLDGSPKIVDGAFSANLTKITDFVGGPVDTHAYNAIRNNLRSIDGIPNTCTSIMLDYLPIPMLKLLTIKFKTTWHTVLIEFQTDMAHLKVPGRILTSYASKIRQGSPLKQSLWECQKELVTAGFEEIARW